MSTTKTLTENEYQSRELRRFDLEHCRADGYFANVREFSTRIEGSGSAWVSEQIEWIENGSYGAGACMALQRAFAWGSESKRRNLEAACGQVVIKCLAGRDYPWKKITPAAREILSDCVRGWLAGEKSWAMTLIDA